MLKCPGVGYTPDYLDDAVRELALELAWMTRQIFQLVIHNWNLKRLGPAVYQDLLSALALQFPPQARPAY